MGMELKKFCQQAHEEIAEIMSQDDGFNRLDTMDFMALMAKHYFCQNLAMEHIWGEFRHITEGTPKSEIPHYANVHGHDTETSMMSKTTSDNGMTITDDELKMWVSQMKNSDGTVGEHWNYETTKTAGEKLGINFQEVSPMCFYVVLNKMYSDGYKTAVKHGVDKVDYYIDRAKDFIYDEDTIPLREKLAVYYHHIFKK